IAARAADVSLSSNAKPASVVREYTGWSFQYGEHADRNSPYNGCPIRRRELLYYELGPTTRESSPTPAEVPARSIGSWVAAALLIAAAVVAAYVAFLWRPSPGPVATATATPT